MGLWNTHGMSKEADDLEIAVDLLGLIPDELVVLSDNAKDQCWIYEQMAKHEKGQVKRKTNLMAGHWRRRARKFKELAAAEEARYAEEVGEENSVI
jgi:hypothetical protein